MRSKARALVWEYFAFGWRPILLALMGTLSIPMVAYLIAYLAQRHHGLSIASVVSELPKEMIQFNLSTVGLLFATTATLFAMETRQRLHVLPMTPWFWLGCKLPLAIAIASAMYLASASLMNFLFSAGWPLWGPALFYAAAVSVIHAALTLSRSMAIRLLACSAVGALLWFWLQSHYSPPTRIHGYIPAGTASVIPRKIWATVSMGDLVTLTSFMIVGYAVSALAMTRDRQGESVIRWSDPFPFVDQFWRPRRFPSPASAQFWMEWKEKGLAIPVCLAVLLGAAAVYITPGNASGDFPGVESLRVSIAMVTLVTAVAPALLGLAIGSQNSAALNRPMGHFRATRPATDAQLSGTTLKTAAASLLLSVLFVAAFLLIQFARLDSIEHMPPYTARSAPETAISIFAAVGPVLVVLWTATALVVSAALTGRLAWIVWPVGGFVAWLTLCVISAYLDPTLSQMFLSTLRRFAWGAGLAVLPLTAWTFYAAVRHSVIERDTAWLAGELWLVLVILAVNLRIIAAPYEAMTMLGFLLIASLSSLPVAPLATAPLALSWNRHR